MGVFGAQSPDEIADVAGECHLSVVQLHGERSADDIVHIRGVVNADVWAVARIDGAEVVSAPRAQHRDKGWEVQRGAEGASRSCSVQ